MNLVFFDLGALLFWSQESLDNKRLISKDGVIVSDKSALDSARTEIDPDVKEMLLNLKKDAFSLNICDTIPGGQIHDILARLGIAELFDTIISAETPDELAGLLSSKRGKQDFAIFAGCNETAVDAALSIQCLTVAYGANRMAVAGKCFARAVSPLDIEDQIRTCLLIHTIARKALEKNAKLLGIDGIAFAGKKVLVSKLVTYLSMLGKETCIVDMEDFHRSQEESYKGENPVEAFYFNAYNYDKLVDEVLEPYEKKGELDTTVFCLDSVDDAFINERHYTISRDGLMILIGPMIFREPLLEFFDMTIYMRVDYREAEHRASLMDVPIYGEDPLESYCKKNIPAQKMYVSRHAPLDNRDFVIDNSNYHRPFFIA